MASIRSMVKTFSTAKSDSEELQAETAEETCMSCKAPLAEDSNRTLSLCGPCYGACLTTIMQDPGAVLTQVHTLAELLSQFLRWTGEDTKMAQTQIESLRTDTQTALSAPYPLALTEKAGKCRNLADRLTESMTAYLRSINTAPWYVNVLSDLEPESCTLNITDEGCYGELTVTARRLIEILDLDETARSLLTLEQQLTFDLGQLDYIVAGGNETVLSIHVHE